MGNSSPRKKGVGMGDLGIDGGASYRTENGMRRTKRSALYILSLAAQRCHWQPKLKVQREEQRICHDLGATSRDAGTWLQGVPRHVYQWQGGEHPRSGL